MSISFNHNNLKKYLYFMNKAGVSVLHITEWIQIKGFMVNPQAVPSV